MHNYKELKKASRKTGFFCSKKHKKNLCCMSQMRQSGDSKIKNH